MAEKVDKARRVLFGEYDGITGISRYYNKERSNPLNQALRVPRLKKGSLRDLSLDRTRPVYQDNQGNSYFGIHEAIKTEKRFFLAQTPVYIFDNHNHALFAWVEANLRQQIQPGAILFHFDQHSDNFKPGQMHFNPNDLGDVHRYANMVSIYEFIAPALANGIVGKVFFVDPLFKATDRFNFVDTKTQCAMTRIGIESPEVTALAKGNFDKKDIILDIDVDYFDTFRWKGSSIEQNRGGNANELMGRDIDTLKDLVLKAGVCTFATSPGYIDQEAAFEYVRRIMK